MGHIPLLGAGVTGEVSAKPQLGLQALPKHPAPQLE